MTSSVRALSILSVVVIFCSCKFQPNGVQPPAIEVALSAERAIEQYDEDRDGKLSKQELSQSALTLEFWDGDGDRFLSREEIQGRLERYLEREVGLIGLGCYVTLDGQPLENAIVRFIPEKFLGDAIQPAMGVTDERGGASLSLSENDQLISGWDLIHIGLYRVTIEHPKVTKPEYTTDTRLSFDVSPLEDIQSPRFELISN